MDKFLTLIKLEYFKRKKSYWLPVWIISGVVGLILVVVLLAWISNNPNVNIHLDDFVFDKDDIRMEVRMTSYGFTVGIAWIFGLFMLMSAQNSLSKEKQLGCELFYKCQPVSIWENTASKYIMHVLANSVALLAVGLIFAVIIAIVTSISYGSFNIMNTVFGAFLGSITYLKICLIFGSLFFLFSAVFNGNSFLKGLGALGLLEGVIAIVDAIFNETLNLPSVFQTLFAMTGTMNLEFIDSITVSRVLGGWGILINLIFAGICYTAATLLYEKKQVETSVSI